MDIISKGTPQARTTRENYVFLLLMFLPIGVCLVNLYLLPEFILPPILYSIGILIAAYLFSPRLVASVAIWSFLLEFLVISIQSVPTVLWITYLLSVALIGYVSTTLSIKSRREAALAEERAGLIRQMEAEQGQMKTVLQSLEESEQRYRAVSAMAQEQTAIAQRRANELEAIIHNIADGVIVCDKEGRVIEVNKAAEKVLGKNKSEMYKRPLSDYLPPLNLRRLDGRPVAQDEMVLARALKGEIVRDFEEIATAPQIGKDVCLLVSAAPIRCEKGEVIAAVLLITDITRIRELDRLKDEFISVAAHELRTPVAIMKGYAQVLLRGADDIPTKRRTMLCAIDRGADRIDRVVHDLLDISRLHLGHLEFVAEKINLTELVDDVAHRIPMTTATHRIRIVAVEQVVVQGDRDRLEQVLVNLIDNAIKYSPEGGSVDIGVEAREDEAVVSVRDYGVGIPKNKQDNIFQRFYRAHAGTAHDYGGMGVGLSISKEIISRHGGKMWFESEDGKGSAFYFTLPLP